MSDMRLPRPSVRAEFRTRLRAELISEAVALAEERRSRPTLAERMSRMFALRLRPIAVAATVAAVILTGSGAAAAGSLPGDAAFGLKRAAEEVELVLARDDDARVRVLAAQVERRLDELGRSSGRPERSPTASAEYEAAVGRFASALAALRQSEPAEKREAVEKVVEAARDKHVQVLETLRERLPGKAQEGIDRALDQHRKIEQQSERGPRNSERPGAAPRAPETPRGGRPSASAPPRR